MKQIFTLLVALVFVTSSQAALRGQDDNASDHVSRQLMGPDMSMGMSCFATYTDEASCNAGTVGDSGDEEQCCWKTMGMFAGDCTDAPDEDCD